MGHSGKPSFRAAVLLTTMLGVSCSSDRGSTTPVPVDHSATDRPAPTLRRGLVVGKVSHSGASILVKMESSTSEPVRRGVVAG
jgi:hypothetical protein